MYTHMVTDETPWENHLPDCAVSLVRQVLPNWIRLHKLTSCKPRFSLPAQILIVSTWQWQKMLFTLLCRVSELYLGRKVTVQFLQPLQTVQTQCLMAILVKSLSESQAAQTSTFQESQPFSHFLLDLFLYFLTSTQTLPKDRHAHQNIQRSQQFCAALTFYKTNLKPLLNPKEQNWNCSSGHCALIEFKS